MQIVCSVCFLTTLMGRAGDSMSTANETVTEYNKKNNKQEDNNDYLADIDLDLLNCKLGKKCMYYIIPEFNYAIPIRTQMSCIYDCHKYKKLKSKFENCFKII